MSRFEGPYGRLYDVAMTHAGMLRAVGSPLGAVPAFVREAYAAAPDQPLLDVPCGAIGSLEHGARVERRAAVVGVDLSPVMLARGRRRIKRLAPGFEVELHASDASDVPYADGTFGTVLSINGLHCMDDPSAVLLELARVSRPGANLFATTLVDDGSRLSHLINGAFRRGGVLPRDPQSLDALTEQLTAAGWQDVTRRAGSGLVLLTARRA